MTEAIVRVNDEGQAEDYTLTEYTDAGGSMTTAITLLRDAALAAEGALADDVRHNAGVVERAMEEDCSVVRIAVPFWFRQKDDEVAETFGSEDSIYALVEDYSDKAWRIIASRTTSMGDRWYNYEWTFVPKSMSTVTSVVGFTDPEDAREALHEARSIRQDQWQQEKDDWESAKEGGWEDMLDHVDGEEDN